MYGYIIAMVEQLEYVPPPPPAAPPHSPPTHPPNAFALLTALSFWTSQQHILQIIRFCCINIDYRWLAFKQCLKYST